MNGARLWTRFEEAYIRWVGRETPYSALAVLLGRSERSVACKAYKLGVGRRRKSGLDRYSDDALLEEWCRRQREKAL